MKILLSIAFAGALVASSAPTAKAFSFDFSGVAAGPLPVSVNVLGYGNVTVTLLSGTASIGNNLGTKTLEFGPSSAVRFDFPTPAYAGTFTFIDLDTNAGVTDKAAIVGDGVAVATGVPFAITDATANVGSTVVSAPVDSVPGSMIVSFTNGSVAGIQQVDFIPEPSTALLAGLGALAIFVRRRR